MAAGIFFLEPDKTLMSDLQTFFLIAPEFEILGSSGIYSEAEQVIKTNPALKCVVIAQDLVDMNCYEAAKRLSSCPIAKIVTLDANSEPNLRNQLEKLPNCHCIYKPYNFSDIIAALKGCLNMGSIVRDNDSRNINEKADDFVAVSGMSVIEQGNQQLSPVYNENSTKTNNIPTQITGNPEISDNPYLANANTKTSVVDVQEMLRNIRREQPIENSSRIIPQQVIAVHNQKGGVGKSTISIDLAVALHQLKLGSNNEVFHAKVCLCDFDLDGADIAVLLNLNLSSPKNSGTFANDLKIESKRISSSRGTVEPIENIRFTPRDIEEKYLQRHDTGIYVLAAPQDKRTSTSVHKGDIKAIIENLKACNFDFIIIDTGPNILDYTIASLIEADTILAVGPCEMTAISRLLAIIQDLQNIPGFMPDKIKLVVNKYDPRINITPEELEGLLRIETYGQVPLFPDITNIHNSGYSVFDNKTVVDINEMKEYQEAIFSIAKKILGLTDRSSSPREEKSKRGFFSSLRRMFK